LQRLLETIEELTGKSWDPPRTIEDLTGNSWNVFKIIEIITSWRRGLG